MDFNKAFVWTNENEGSVFDPYGVGCIQSWMDEIWPLLPAAMATAPTGRQKLLKNALYNMACFALQAGIAELILTEGARIQEHWSHPLTDAQGEALQGMFGGTYDATGFDPAQFDSDLVGDLAILEMRGALMEPLHFQHRRLLAILSASDFEDVPRSTVEALLSPATMSGLTVALYGTWVRARP